MHAASRTLASGVYPNPDGWEVWNGVSQGFYSPNPNNQDANLDPDNDWLVNIDEYDNYLRPNDPDHDSDGRPDGVEHHNDLDPKNADIDWTFMTYFACDNNRQNQGLTDFNEMKSIGCTDEITVIAQFDGISGDYASSKRFILAGDNKYEIEGLGEKNTGDLNTFSNFISWGLDDFPAEKYALFLWSHGYAWEGCCNDETSGGDLLNLSELKCCWPCQPGDIDLIGSACCYLQTSEVIYQLKNSINPKVMVNSEFLTAHNHWYFDDILEYLKDNSGCTAAEFGEQIIQVYIDNAGCQNYQATISAVDVAKFSNLKDSADDLAEEFKLAMDSEWKTYYKGKFNETRDGVILLINMADLYYFANKIIGITMVNQDINDTHATKLKQYAGDVKKYRFC